MWGEFRSRNDCIVPVIKGKTPVADIICPAKGYAIKSRAVELYGNEGEYDINLGYTTFHAAARSTDEKILKNATSGGVITDILFYLLDKKIVDKVSVSQFVCDEEGVKTHSFHIRIMWGSTAIARCCAVTFVLMQWENWPTSAVVMPS